MDNSIIVNDIEEIWSEVDLRPLADKSILITGATGLIGTYFIYSLLKFNSVSSDKVTIRLVTYRGLPNHLKDLSKESNVEIYKGNLQEKDFCMSLPISDYIIHAAGYSQIMSYKGNLIGAIRLNTSTTDALFERLNPNGGRILFVSSGAVYTGSTDFPHKEETIGATMPNHTRAPYIEGKRCGETICHTLNSENRIAKIVCKFHNPIFAITFRAENFRKVVVTALNNVISVFDIRRNESLIINPTNFRKFVGVRNNLFIFVKVNQVIKKSS